MTTITTHAATTAATAAPVATRARVSWRSGLVAVVVAAAATTVLAAVLRTVGIGLQVGGEPIPVLGFAQLVTLGGLIGIVLARHLSRTTFLRVAVVLTALSCVPSIALGDTVADRIGLVLTHLVAAAIIVPRLARR